MNNILGNNEAKMKKHAFTLAEVLVTLGIIGIVAAMTLPTVINKTKEKEFHVAYKKAYSSMSQAFLRMQADDAFLDMTPTVAGVPGTPAIGENFKIMSKYFKAIHTCFDNNADECWECKKGESGSMSGSAPDWLGCRKTNYAFVDYSGMGWYLYSNVEWPVLVDVNGKKGPNKLGKDRFVMRFASNTTDDTYFDSADKIVPWKDIPEKTRWCPSGNCLYQTWLID